MKESPSPKKKQPWPTQKVMEQIYEQNLWGGSPDTFYSGTGSHDPKMTEPYLEAVIQFLRSFEKPLIVCDLGCGDFNVGQQIRPFTQKYIGVDIVAELIDYNQKNFNEPNTEFHCLDLSKDPLPSGDCAILRNVLQHLCNEEVHAILQKLRNYKYLLITEHIPEGSFVPNLDILSGQGIRLKKQSGIDVLAPPFDLKVKEATTLCSVQYEPGKGKVITNLYEL